MHFLQLSEIEQRLRQISWALKALMQEVMQDSHQIMLQCPKFPLLSQSWEVRHPVRVGSCNLSLPNSHHKCSYPKARTNRVQSNHCGKWLPVLAKPGPTIREAFQYGYRLLRLLESDPACEPPAESMSSTSRGTGPPGISSLTEAGQWAAKGRGNRVSEPPEAAKCLCVSWCFMMFPCISDAWVFSVVVSISACLLKFLGTLGQTTPELEHLALICTHAFMLKSSHLWTYIITLG